MPFGAGIDDAGSLSYSSGLQIPVTTLKMRKHLRRLERVWIDWPIDFITTSTFNRRRILASEKVAKILTEEWRSAHDRHEWAIGRYVIIPDHVHFFCSAELDAKSIAGVHAGMEAMDE